jgi:ATP-binding cassette subfamily B (MDR/TAP) protein 1
LVNIQEATFSYPSRSNERVLKSVNVFARPGHRVALVGHSGSGKSTVLSLLERFYDITEGGVAMIEDENLTHWNLHYLRDQISLVGQEPGM